MKKIFLKTLIFFLILIIQVNILNLFFNRVFAQEEDTHFYFTHSIDESCYTWDLTTRTLTIRNIDDPNLGIALEYGTSPKNITLKCEGKNRIGYLYSSFLTIDGDESSVLEVVGSNNMGGSTRSETYAIAVGFELVINGGNIIASNPENTDSGHLGKHFYGVGGGSVSSLIMNGGNLLTYGYHAGLITKDITINGGNIISYCNASKTDASSTETEGKIPKVAFKYIPKFDENYNCNIKYNDINNNPNTAKNTEKDNFNEVSNSYYIEIIEDGKKFEDIYPPDVKSLVLNRNAVTPGAQIIATLDLMNAGDIDLENSYLEIGCKENNSFSKKYKLKLDGSKYISEILTDKNFQILNYYIAKVVLVDYKGNEKQNTGFTYREFRCKEPFKPEGELVKIKITGTENQQDCNTMFKKINNERTYNGYNKLACDYYLTKFAMKRAAELSIQQSNDRPSGRPDANDVFPEYKYDTPYREYIFKGSHKWSESDTPEFYYDSINPDTKSVGISKFTINKDVYYVYIFCDEIIKEQSMATNQYSRKEEIEVLLNKLNLTINKKYINLDENENVYDIEITNGNLLINKDSFIWKSSNENVAAVTEYGDINSGEQGNAIVTAQIGSKKFEINVDVVYTIKDIAINKSELELEVGEEENLNVSFEPNNTIANRQIIWTSSNPGIVDVDQEGKIKAKAVGEVTITATTANNISKTCKVKSKKQLKSIEFEQSEYSIKNGDVLKLFLNLNPVDATLDKNIEYSIEGDKNIEIISTNNKYVTIRGKTPGKATVVAKAGDLIAKSEINVFKPITGIEINEEQVNIKKNDKIQISAKTFPTDATENSKITWESSDTSIATVDENGIVTGVKAGIASISASCCDYQFIDTIPVYVYEVGIEDIYFEREVYDVQKRKYNYTKFKNSSRKYY